MTFEQIQQQTHHIADTKVLVSYDRFTTRFELKKGEEVIYSTRLLFLPIKNVNILINEQEFTLKIFWFILWKSTLVNNDNVVIKELLVHRRKKSIGLLSYCVLVSCIKVSLDFMV